MARFTLVSLLAMMIRLLMPGTGMILRALLPALALSCAKTFVTCAAMSSARPFSSAAIPKVWLRIVSTSKFLTTSTSERRCEAGPRIRIMLPAFHARAEPICSMNPSSRFTMADGPMKRSGTALTPWPGDTSLPMSRFCASPSMACSGTTRKFPSDWTSPALASFSVASKVSSSCRALSGRLLTMVMVLACIRFGSME